MLSFEFIVAGGEWDKARRLQEKMQVNLIDTTERMSELGEFFVKKSSFVMYV